MKAKETKRLFQESLPEHLRGKRPKDMSPEEKKEYNNFRSKCSRMNKSKEEHDISNKKEAKVKAEKRAQETEEKKKEK